jgi:hypothetical protein
MRKFLWIGAAVLLIAFLGSRLIAPSDSAEIEEAITTVATSKDPGFCDAFLTQAYLEQMTGVKAPYADELCEEAARLDAADAVDVTDVDVNGDEATATATYSGSSLDGSSLVVRLVRSDGDWKLDRKLRVEFLNRAGLERGYREVLVSPDYRFSEAGASCVIAETRQLTDAELADSVLSRNVSRTAPIRRDLGAPSRRPQARHDLSERL